MQVTQISDTYMVSAQISAADVAEAKEFGFDTIMCNRPDGEDASQPTAAEIQAAAEAAGMKFFFVPMSPANIPDDIVEQVQAAIVPENGKVLAYCRSGKRSEMLWKMANQ